MTPNPIENACRLLREGAAELKNCHTLAATGHDWTGEPEAKAAYDEHTAAADALERVHAECETLRTGYAAERLEIESLRARGAPPDVSGYVSEWSGGLCTSDEAMDGIARLYAAQPAGAQQPGAAYAALPDDREAFKTYLKECDECAIVPDVAGAFNAAWQIASHGQAPAQAIPAAAAGCTRSHPHENMDSACRAKAAIAEMQNMAARGAEATTHDLERFVAMLAAAPTTQPAPQQDASPTAGMNIAQRILHVGGRNNAAGYVEFGSIQAVEALVRQVLRDLPAAPQPSPASQGDVLDTVRLDWMGADEGGRVFHLGKSWYTRSSYGMPCRKQASLREAIDAARAAQEGRQCA